jgi:sec-independent protein translocase protein TatA
MFTTMTNTLAIYFPGGWEWIVILIVALLIFGKRLPDVGKSMGKGIVEFKKGLKGMKEEMDEINSEVEDATNRPDDEEQGEPRRLSDSGSAGAGQAADEAGSREPSASPAADEPQRGRAEVS